MSRLISDNDVVTCWLDSLEGYDAGDVNHDFARRIESLVRKRLAERLRAEALKWEGVGQGDGLLGAANIVEGEE